MPSGVQIEGLRSLVRDLQKAGVELDDLKDIFAQISVEGSRLASSFAPDRSGRLAATVRGNRAKNKAVVTAGRARVPYAGPINYGWPKRNIAPALFLQKADTRMQERAPQILEQGLQDLLDKYELT